MWMKQGQKMDGRWIDGDSIEASKLNPIASHEGLMFASQRNKTLLWK